MLDSTLVSGDVCVDELARARAALEAGARAAKPIIIDRAMVRVYELAGRMARGTISVLLTGETGTGKEVLAEYIHAVSPRARAPLMRG